MLLIRIIVPKDPATYDPEMSDDGDMFPLIQYTQNTEERHAFAANKIAMHFASFNVRFRKDCGPDVPFFVDALYYPLELEIEYKNIVEMLQVTDNAIRKFERNESPDPKDDIERMRKLLSLHDKLVKMGAALKAHAAEIKHSIAEMLEDHKGLYL